MAGCRLRQVTRSVIEMKTFTQFWADERGFVVSSELVLIATIVVIGLLAGLTTLRDQVALEMGDVANSIGNVKQSFSFSGVVGHSSSVAGSSFSDQSDFCENFATSDRGRGAKLNSVNPGVAVVSGE